MAEGQAKQTIYTEIKYTKIHMKQCTLMQSTFVHCYSGSGYLELHAFAAVSNVGMCM